MSDIFRVHVFPAQRGDALWIEYGPAATPFRILVDGGITKTGREYLIGLIDGLGDSRIDLLVVTHIDLDHIQGVIALLKDLPPKVKIDRVWFNGWEQLPRLPLQPQGVAEGIALSKQLEARFKPVWNHDAGGSWIGVGPEGAPRIIALPGGMVATVLSPDNDKLLALRDIWDSVVEEFGAAVEAEEEVEEVVQEAIDGLESMGTDEIDVAELAKGRFQEDDAVPNGSSIAFLLTFKGKSALLLADAHPSLVLASVKALSPGQRLRADCVKLSHHGSKYNTSLDLAMHLESPRWIFSSNGATTKHPNPEAVARVLHGCPGKKELIFNYRTKYNEMWDDVTLMADHNYTAVYGDGVKPMVVDLLP